MTNPAKTCPCGKPSKPRNRKCSACINRTTRANAKARTQQGPSGSVHRSPPVEVAEGLELRQQTTQVNPDGTLRTRYDKTALARPDEPAFEPVPAGHHV